MESMNCFSSRLMRPLLEWRNPAGNELTWEEGDEKFSGLCPNYLSYKVIVTQINLSLLAVAAIIETILSGVLSILSLVLIPIRPSLSKVFVLLNRNALNALGITCITIFAAIKNPFYKNIPTMPRSYVNGLPPLTPVSEEERTIKNAVKFVKKEILPHLTATERKEELCDLHVLNFVVTRALYLYTYGSKKGEALPKFFSASGITHLQELRQGIKTKEAGIKGNSTQEAEETERKKALSIYVQNPETVDTEPSDSIRALVNELKNIALSELRDGLLIKSLLVISQEDVQ